MSTTIKIGTLYIRGGFGYEKVEATQIHYELVEYAQFRNAVRVTFLPKRKRLKRQITECYRPRIVVLEGWGHPDPPGIFKRKDVTNPGITLYETRHISCAEAWDAEFDLFLQSYLNTGSAKVMIDYRGFIPETKVAAVLPWKIG
jgi:hypothetical protein